MENLKVLLKTRLATTSHEFPEISGGVENTERICCVLRRVLIECLTHFLLSNTPFFTFYDSSRDGEIIGQDFLLL